MKTGKTMTRMFTLLLCLCLLGSFAIPAFAAPVGEATIDTGHLGSISIYKYDFTNASKDGVWDGSYVSTGVYDQSVNDTLGGATRAGDDDSVSDLGNGQNSNGYAIKGVEFTYLKVADIVQFTESANDGVTYDHIEVLYGIDKTKGAGLLSAIGLADGANRYENADNTDKLSSDSYYYQSDVLISALRSSLAYNATAVKDALERYIKAGGGTPMAETDADGHTGAGELPVGLYLVVETKVPEMVTCTTDPFFVSIPMTSVNGTNATDGGTRWMYDITLYPKNETGIPTLEKTVREASADTGKNDGSASDITDGYSHNATASEGDTVEYQIISTLPRITSAASYLSDYSFVDTVAEGITYNKGDVVLEWFTDASCTQKITAWVEQEDTVTNPAPFLVSYSTAASGEGVMSITVTETGLSEINTAKTVYKDAGAVQSGYSGCTLRITYAATVNSDKSFVIGDAGNRNKVVMTWKRTSDSYYDTLVDDCHVYSYGVDLTKVFSDGKGDYRNVRFVLYNETDGYWVQAALNEDEGIYYVTGHLTGDRETEAEGRTLFVPVESDGVPGKVLVKGLEDDTYILTEVQTDSGYTLLKDSTRIVISQTETEGSCTVYDSDVLGVLQNDPRYATVINDPGDLLNMPQTHLEHKLLTASATVDGNDVTMLSDNDSVNALVPLKVVNTHGYDLPKTGEGGALLLPLLGCALAAVCICLIVVLMPKRKKDDQQSR